ncbi:MAG: hypothetical protein P8078_03245, partial [bacterium]
VVAGMMQCFAVGYLYRVQDFRAYLNNISEVKLGNWWVIALRYITPLALLIILVINLRSEILQTYNNYPRWATLVGGWGVLFFFLVLGFFLWRSKGKDNN